MKPIGYLVLINNAFPETIAFDKKDSIEIAKRFNPKAVKYVTRTYTERRSASELARLLAFDNNETREEIIIRVKRELNTYWNQTHF